ncbi:MAG: glycosyltransferase family 1 protein, partial [Candidatus Saccharibacteria bacterium]
RQSGVGEVLHSIFRYDFWDIDVLADQLVGIATSPALEQSLKQNIKHEYDRISWHDVATTCLRVYQTVKQGVPS